MAEGERVRLTVDTNRLHVVDTDGNAIPKRQARAKRLQHRFRPGAGGLLPKQASVVRRITCVG